MSRQQQLLLDFDAKPAPAPRPTRQVNPDSSLSTNRLAAVAVADPSPDVAQRPSVTLTPLVLKWDFRTSFPEPREDAIEAGKLHDTDVLPENLRSLHLEHERAALACLAELDLITDARRRGIDPGTGKSPSTEKRRIALEERFQKEPPRLQHAFDVLMDVYAEGFGEEAADEFRKAVKARHHGIEVLDETSAPVHASTPAAIEAGRFGHEEDGTAVEPMREELDEITQDLADRLRNLPVDSPIRGELFQQYVDDFGEDAGSMLREWLDKQARLEVIVTGHQYDPGHSWHYYHEGDNADPVPLETIPLAEHTPEQLGVKLPRNPERRREKLRVMLADAGRQLERDERRYEELVERGAEALSEYDRTIAHGGNDELAWASAMAFAYNHVRYSRGRLKLLDSMHGQPVFNGMTEK